MEDNKSAGQQPVNTTEKGTLKRIFQDRERTNILRASEQWTISFLVKRIPDYISSDMLTFTGTIGCLIVMLGFILGSYLSPNYLLLGIPGLALNWFGDSLDGRMAYYRHKPRKWYGFSLDVVMDWIGMVLIGLGYLVYSKGTYELIPFLFVVLYGWAMIITQLRYKITDLYTIDAGVIGPTEIRFILVFVLVFEVVFNDTIKYFAAAMVTILSIINIVDTVKLLKLGDIRDQAEREEKAARETKTGVNND